ncbi:MAG: two-component sensor histidine kinase [Parcubacteria group bacterium Licking1014_1]|nr:MAG: two-component sensor histidine kinase [Parcubacteria group bacterium Licking1014_1]
MSKKNIISASNATILKLKALAKEKEDVRKKLAVTAEGLRLKAKRLAVIARKKESIRHKLVETTTTTTTTTEKIRFKDKKLAEIAKEKEFVRFRLLKYTKDLEQSRLATLNVLEDLQSEKEALINAKAKDEALLQSIGDGIIATGLDKKIIAMNKMAEKLLGWKTDEAIGKLYDEVVSLEDEKGTFVPPEEKPLHKAFIHGTTTTTTTTTGLYLFSKNKIKFPVAITISPIILDDKRIGAVEVFRDITKEKEMEKLRTDFLALASHQLRTPLSGTKWLIETMQKGITGKIEPKEKEYLGQVYQLNERMIQLVSEMLSALRLESGTEAIKKEVISVTDFYQNLIASVALPAKSRWVVLRNSLKNIATLKNKKIKVESDAQMLKTILDCFVSNAINYSSPGQEVILDAKEEKDTIILSVKDNGIGIPEEEQKRIFERFYRASNAKALKPAGSGLGLNIAKTLAEKVGATISFESKENKGTMFYLTIPKKIV